MSECIVEIGVLKFKIYVSSRGLKAIPLEPTASTTNLIYTLNCQKVTGCDCGK